MNKFEKRYSVEVVALGQRVRAIRERLRMSQLDLEIASGINRTEISRIENGQKNVEFITIVKLAVALEVDINEFFTTVI